MTKSEIHVIRRALEFLNQLVPQDQMPNKGDPAPGHCPVRRFAQEYLAPDPTSDVSCEELWFFFREIAEAGELPPLRKAAFLGRLPSVMDYVFSAKKCHSIERSGRRVRGFRGINFRANAELDSKVVPGGRRWP